MRTRLFFATLVSFSVIAGVAFALKSPLSVSAGSENVRWMAGVAVLQSGEYKWCFGTNLWHPPSEGNWGADVFADADSPCCGYPTCGSQLNSTVYAWTLGQTTVYNQYYLGGKSYNGQYLFGSCKQTHVQAYWWDPGIGNWRVIGYEIYEHTTTQPAGGVPWFQIWIGSGWWQPSWTPIATTTWPDSDCGPGGAPTSEHLHQSYASASGSPVTASKNSTRFSGNGIYKTFNASALNDWIHNWTGWGQ